jgi:hypothetical protein
VTSIWGLADLNDRPRELEHGCALRRLPRADLRQTVLAERSCFCRSDRREITRDRFSRRHPARDQLSLDGGRSDFDETRYDVAAAG